MSPYRSHRSLYRWTITLCVLWTGHILTAQSGVQKLDFKSTNNIRLAYEAALDLRIAEARQLLSTSARTDPGNLMAILIEDYADFIELFVSEDPELYKKYKTKRDQRIEALKAGNPESPYYMYARAEVHLHWSVLRFRFGEYFAAAADINRAFRLYKRNDERFPDFGPNLKSLGILKCGVGTIPDKYMWAIKLFSSLEGTVLEGLGDLERGISVMEADRTMELREAQLLYAQALYHFKNDGRAAWKYLQSCDLAPADNILDCLILANIGAKSGHNDEAIELLVNLPSGDGRMKIPYADLLLGRAKLHRLDRDADVPLKRFVNGNDKATYVKEAWQKLAWHALIYKGEDAYVRYMDSCRLNGMAEIDEDASALKEAERGVIPHKELLKVRLLFDGSYYNKALAQIQGIDKSTLSAEEALEYEYRYARILDEQGNYAQAIQHYTRTIEMGADSERYFACNAALKCGEMCERQTDFKRALGYYEQCLDLKPSEYQASIHQKAKSGISRIQSARE